jgi:uncharacterized protein YcbX
VVSAKHPGRWSAMLTCQASYVDEPRSGLPLPPVRITLPDGRSVTSEDSDADRLLSDFFGRQVTVVQGAPVDFVVDDYHPDIEGMGRRSSPGTVTEQKLGAALFAELGLPSAVPERALVDMFPLSLVTTSTLTRLAELAPGSSFDPRRFRMNVTVESLADGFVENSWPGRTLQIGDQAACTATMPDPRCVMTTLAQEGLPKDNRILQAAAQHNRLEIGTTPMPCVGVYAVVTAPGPVAVGDTVRLG